MHGCVHVAKGIVSFMFTEAVRGNRMLKPERPFTCAIGRMAQRIRRTCSDGLGGDQDIHAPVAIPLGHVWRAQTGIETVAQDILNISDPAVRADFRRRIVRDMLKDPHDQSIVGSPSGRPGLELGFAEAGRKG